MGATTFTDKATANTADEAFRNLVNEALWEYGHGGYSGTIAEKPGFTLLTPPGPYPDGVTAEKLAYHLLDCDYDNPCATRTHRRNPETNQWEVQYTPDVYPANWTAWLQRAYSIAGSKWDEAACLQIGPNEWLFFGWASC